MPSLRLFAFVVSPCHRPIGGHAQLITYVNRSYQPVPKNGRQFKERRHSLCARTLVEQLKITLVIHATGVQGQLEGLLPSSFLKKKRHILVTCKPSRMRLFRAGETAARVVLLVCAAARLSGCMFTIGRYAALPVNGTG